MDVCPLSHSLLHPPSRPPLAELDGHGSPSELLLTRAEPAAARVGASQGPPPASDPPHPAAPACAWPGAWALRKVEPCCSNASSSCNSGTAAALRLCGPAGLTAVPHAPSADADSSHTQLAAPLRRHLLPLPPLAAAPAPASAAVAAGLEEGSADNLDMLTAGGPACPAAPSQRRAKRQRCSGSHLEAAELYRWAADAARLLAQQRLAGHPQGAVLHSLG